jgi:hypothetical protein
MNNKEYNYSFDRLATGSSLGVSDGRLEGIEEGEGEVLRRRGDRRVSVSTIDVGGGRDVAKGVVEQGDVERRRSDRRKSVSGTGDRDRDRCRLVTGMSCLPVGASGTFRFVAGTVVPSCDVWGVGGCTFTMGGGGGGSIEEMFDEPTSV